MSSTRESSASPRPLPARILAELTHRPGRRAGELATALGVDRKEVNRCLTDQLAGQVRQDQSYRWYVLEAAAEKPAAAPGAAAQSDLARLCRYYLECIGQDNDEGVSLFAAVKKGEPDYASLPALPTPASNRDWWNAPGVSRVLGKVAGDRTKLGAWVGYPVRLRPHRTANWQGFFVEPVLMWRVELPEEPGDAYQVTTDLPTPNFKFLRSLAMGDSSQMDEEATRLADDLGLNNPAGDAPETDELIDRLSRIRPDWDWREPLDPEKCSEGPPLSALSEAGIYNRAIVAPAERSPYTVGLESELKALSEMDESAIADRALGQWLSGNFTTTRSEDTEPLIEVLPMNSEQRAAVRSALTAAHTVVTGPPGTGKSQVVTNLLVNAAWRGMKVLFASKNNKAVNVVEARVNGLGNRPVLLRLGSGEYQAKVASYLAALLAGSIGKEHDLSYQEGLQRHRHLAGRMDELDQLQERTLAARNLVDKLEADVEDLRLLFGADRFNALDTDLLANAQARVADFEAAIQAANRTSQGFLTRLFWPTMRDGRIRKAAAAREGLQALATYLDTAMPSILSESDISGARRALGFMKIRVAAAIKVVTYQKALDDLRGLPAFEDIARQRQALMEEIGRNSAGLWRDWVQLAPARLTPAQRKDVADFTALLQLLNGPSAATVHYDVRKRARVLQQKVTTLFSCWAVTSLSAKSQIPFEPGFFDLVVIDEASQCDIASVLPLLYRAKRTVIIGDPMQLRHISAMTGRKDSELQVKHRLLETRAAWMYSVNSLFDLAAGVVTSENIVNLRDHHRAHADIIEFSNVQFYDRRLRIATRYSNLKRPQDKSTGVVWQNLRGQTIRPANGSAQNRPEAEAVMECLRDLLLTRGYTGTLGVVTPFRAQAQLLQELLSLDAMLTEAGGRCELLVDTVHRFQGDERDAMFFSPVISEGAPAGALNFLRKNGNLFNVAITRARGLLHVVGDRSTAMTSGVDYLEKFGEYVSTLNKANGASQAGAVEPGPDFPTVSRPERVSDWERVLYHALYEAGIRPIPQYSVDQYDLDFAIVIGDRRLNIEVDGERYHRSWTGELCLRDQLRNQWLIELGWEVRRFWVYEIRDRMPDCVRVVREWVEVAGQSV
jgi:very-short-patch-repair endonuclease